MAKSVSEVVRSIIANSIEVDKVYAKKELVQIAKDGYEGEKSEVTDGIVTGAVRELGKVGILTTVGYGLYAKGAGDCEMSIQERIDIAIRNFKTELSNAIKATDALSCSNEEFKIFSQLRETMPELEKSLNKLFNFGDVAEVKEVKEVKK